MSQKSKVRKKEKQNERKWTIHLAGPRNEDFIGLFSILVIAWLKTPIGVWSGGAEECPPAPLALLLIFVFIIFSQQ